MAKAYRLLKAIMNTAVDDGRDTPQPLPDQRCQWRKPRQSGRFLTVTPGLHAGRGHRPALPRPGLARRVQQPPLGRAGGLRRSDIDLAARTVRVIGSSRSHGGGLNSARPSLRRKPHRALPAVIVPRSADHLVRSPRKARKAWSSSARTERHCGTPTSGAGYGWTHRCGPACPASISTTSGILEPPSRYCGGEPSRADGTHGALHEPAA